MVKLSFEIANKQHTNFYYFTTDKVIMWITHDINSTPEAEVRLTLTSIKKHLYDLACFLTINKEIIHITEPDTFRITTKLQVQNALIDLLLPEVFVQIPTLEQWKTLIEPQRCPHCSAWLQNRKLNYHPHKGGWKVHDMEEKQWLYVTCNCPNDWSLDKLGVPHE